jgi:hypothetical protein
VPTARCRFYFSWIPLKPNKNKYYLLYTYVIDSGGRQQFRVTSLFEMLGDKMKLI